MPCPEELVRFLLACGSLICAARTVPKGSYGMNVPLFEIDVQNYGINDLEKIA
jgi:hypothetical protein